MEIELFISTHNLGDCNTTADNERYCAAVEKELQQHYPDAYISVKLTENPSSSCYVSDDDEEIKSEIYNITDNVWNRADY